MNWDINNLTSAEKGVLIAAGVVGIFVLIAFLGMVYLWIKYSLFRRNNSQDLTGGELTQKIFESKNLSIKIKSSFFYSKYWNHNKRKNTYRLRPWTNNRKSIWTLMESAQQAYATTIRETNKKTFWLAFRLPQVISIGGAIIGVGLMIWAYNSAVAFGDLNSWTFQIWTRVILGVSIVLLAQVYALVARAWFLKRDAVDLIKGFGLTEMELKAIQRIFNWGFFLAVMRAILETIRVILQILEVANGDRSKR